MKLRGTKANDSDSSDGEEDSKDNLGDNLRFTTRSKIGMDKSMFPALKKSSRAKQSSKLRQRTSIEMNSSVTERPRRLKQKGSDLSNISMESKRGIDFLKPPSCHEIAEVTNSNISTHQRISSNVVLNSLPVSSRNMSLKRLAVERPSHADTRATSDIDDQGIRVVEEVNQQMRKQILKKNANSISQWTLNE